MSSLVTPTRFFFGLGSTASLYRYGTLPTDDGAAVLARVETQKFAPAGVGGEAIFTAIMPVIVYTAAVTIRFTPIVDGLLYSGGAGLGVNAAVPISLTQPTDGRRAWWRGDLGLSLPYVRDSIDRGRYALRGTWFQLRAEVTSVIGLDTLGNPGVVLLEGCDLEFEPVGVSVDRVASPAYP